ncbi:uncharacterized protein BYT42DRAFT_552650 [Radiomyces spectabilis]|uniref:uncharacterized protein n=1 Tax=Radiomyces spectabilis TaxID=64574 RepID=UPI00221F5F0D|nr:uncharacterized protein BYT42DRAFT_552650 [Radiomyces spectabilis]KAI8393912.1 hypothetical protein BYT42DRAFT_552650 [Radiomyces spectabilis]
MTSSFSTSSSFLELERQVSLQELQDQPQLTFNEPARPLRYVSIHNRQFRRPPAHFYVQTTREYYNHDHRILCYPGAVFQGTVHIKLNEPLAAQHVKLIFKASEKINYDALGWSKKAKSQRLFAVRTILWGASEAGHRPHNAWPVMEAGEHAFPFMCEMPLVNYPPSFRHYLVNVVFSLIAVIERPGQRPFQTEPYLIQYQPVVETHRSKLPILYRDEARVTNQISARIALPGLAYTITDAPIVIPLKFSLCNVKSKLPMAKVRVLLQQKIRITNGKSLRVKAATVHVAEHSFRSCKADTESMTFRLRLQPEEITPNLTYSERLKIEYTLIMTVKLRHGLLVTKRTLFEVPIWFGTLMSGAQPPVDLVNFTDDQVMHDSTLQTKPKFLRSPNLDEEYHLPPYDAIKPPEYAAATAHTMIAAPIPAASS